MCHSIFNLQKLPLGSANMVAKKKKKKKKKEKKERLQDTNEKQLASVD
jgi:hypothetical protein